jgi:hypothetical protein
VLLVLCGFAAGLNYRADFMLKKEKAWIWLLMVIAFVFMAFDEFFQFHEALRNKVLAPRGIRLPGFSWTAPGDFVLIVYAFAGLVMIPAIWRRLAQRKASLVFFLIGVGLAAIAVGIDSLDFTKMTHNRLIVDQFIEEVLETYGMLCFFIAFYLRESFLMSEKVPAG